MHITTSWLHYDEPGPEKTVEAVEDEATLAELTVSIGEHIFTRAEDTLTGNVREHAILPAHQLAQWLVWHWWRLRWEPRHSNRLARWSPAHNFSCIGGGWLWPNIECQSDGQRMIVRSFPTSRVPIQPLHYLGGEVVAEPVADFEAGSTVFIESVISRLRSTGQLHADLIPMWEELRAEQADDELVFYRRIEAMLGCDPDEANPSVIRQYQEAALRMGAESVAELAGMGNHFAGADHLVDEARQYGSRSRPNDRFVWHDGKAPVIDKARPAWRNGVDAAKLLRSEEQLAGTPLSDKKLTEWFAVSEAYLSACSDTLPFAYELAEPARNLSQVVLRSKWSVGRRFELARLLGDSLLDNSGETLHPATPEYTYRQKMQRAFAAELLCPIEALKDFLAGDYSEESQQNAAKEFNVSEIVVGTQLVNNRVIDQRYDIELDADTAA